MRYDKTLPTKIDLGYRRVNLASVKYDEEFHSQMGQFENQDNRVIICITGESTTDANTLIHEILHLIYNQYLLDDALALRGKKKSSDMVRKDDKEIAEERIVNSIANGLTEMYMRNPRIAEWLWERLNG